MLSSWGQNGYCNFWLDGGNHWVYRPLHEAATRMVRLAQTHQNGTDGLTRRSLNQAGRELLLAQASDWPFIINAGTAVDYAKRRLTAHLHRFHRIAERLADGQTPEPAWLTAVEAMDNCFAGLDYRLFTPVDI